MRIDTKILRKLLKITRIKALKLVNELKESRSPQGRKLRSIIGPGILLRVGVEKNRFLNFIYSRTLFKLVAERVVLL